MKEETHLYGFKNARHKIVIRAKFDAVADFIDGKAPVVLKGQSGFCDTSGKFTALQDYSFNVLSFEPSGESWVAGAGDHLIPVKNEEGKFGFVNSSGKLVIPCRYEDAEGFRAGLSSVKKAGKYGYIDTAGKTVIGFRYDEAAGFYDNRACVNVGGKSGYINRKGELVIPSIYVSAFYFSEGLGCVSKSEGYEGYCYIDSTGKAVIKGPFERAEPFKNGKATVQKNGKCMEINHEGKKIRSLPSPCPEGC